MTPSKQLLFHYVVASRSFGVIAFNSATDLQPERF